MDVLPHPSAWYIISSGYVYALSKIIKAVKVKSIVYVLKT
jgi:hypothetical protein